MGDAADDMWDESLLAKDNYVTEDPPEIEFNEESHLYIVNGVPKPDRSVTQRLKAVGISDYRGVDPYYADRGSRAHDGCTHLARGSLRWESLQEDILPFVRTFGGLIWSLGLSYVSSEVPCYDEELNVVGKYDLIMMWEGKRTLVELKTGDVPDWLGLQLAAYERMVDVEEVLGLELKGYGRVLTKADDYHLNDKVWRDINEGRFDLDVWKKDKKRRRMKRIL